VLRILKEDLEVESVMLSCDNEKSRSLKLQ